MWKFQNPNQIIPKTLSTFQAQDLLNPKPDLNLKYFQKIDNPEPKNFLRVPNPMELILKSISNGKPEPEEIWTRSTTIKHHT